MSRRRACVYGAHEDACPSGMACDDAGQCLAMHTGVEAVRADLPDQSEELRRVRDERNRLLAGMEAASEQLLAIHNVLRTAAVRVRQALAGKRPCQLDKTCEFDWGHDTPCGFYGQCPGESRPGGDVRGREGT